MTRNSGVDWVIAGAMIAEIGVDMSVFPGAAHLAAWAALCPGNHESAGRQRSGNTRKGNVWLKTAMVTAAIAAAKARRSYYAEKEAEPDVPEDRSQAPCRASGLAQWHRLDAILRQIDGIPDLPEPFDPLDWAKRGLPLLSPGEWAAIAELVESLMQRRPELGFAFMQEQARTFEDVDACTVPRGFLIQLSCASDIPEEWNPELTSA
jgi:hypothetical protein